MVKLVVMTSAGPESVTEQLPPDAATEIPLAAVIEWLLPGHCTLRSKVAAPVHAAVIDRPDPASMA